MENIKGNVRGLNQLGFHEEMGLQNVKIYEENCSTKADFLLRAAYQLWRRGGGDKMTDDNESRFRRDSVQYIMVKNH